MRYIILFLCLFLFSFCNIAEAWHPEVKSVCKQEDGSYKVVYNWFGDGNTWTIKAGNTGTTGNPNCFKNGSSHSNSGNCKNYFSPDPKTRTNQPTSFPAGNSSSFYSTTFSGDSLSWRVGPSTATAYKTSTLCENCQASVSGSFSSDGKSFTATSSKDLSHVELEFCDGSKYKFDNLIVGKSYTFSKNKCLVRVKVKSGCVEKQFTNPKSCCVTDCAGIIGGTAIKDACGLCGGDNSTCKDCAGTVNGGKTIDQCGVCGGNNSTCKDCAGVVKGSSKIDECGICGGDSSSCKDCAGLPNGTSQIDQCGVCGGDSSICKDCAGTPNGQSRMDECGVCGGNGDSCRCPVIVVDYNTVELIENARILANDRTIAYYVKAYGCSSKSTLRSIATTTSRLNRANSDLAKALAQGNSRRIAQYQRSVVNYTAQLNKLYVQLMWAHDRIVIVQQLLQQYIELVKTLSKPVQVCPGQCADLNNSATLNYMSYLIEVIYTLAAEAQRSAATQCRTRAPGIANTKTLTTVIQGSITACHSQNQVCS